MKKFRFSLDAVLRVKRQLEDQRRRDLALAQALRDQALAHLGALESDLKGLNQAQAERRQERRIDLAVEGWFQGSHAALTGNIVQAREGLAAKKDLLDAARNRAIEAARERKVLEKLEEQQRLEHQLKSNREEQGFMDEMAQHALSVLTYASPSASVE